jgi:phage gpG-like protein
MKYVKDDKREQKRLEKVLYKMAKAPHVAVGILQDNPVGDSFSMLDLATVHEFGSKDGRIPQRSFIRSVCDAKQKEHLKLIAKLQGRLLAGKIAMKQALGIVGSAVTSDIVQTINAGIKPELKLATIKRKKSSKPLIDTGRLKGSITHEVRGAL